MVSLQLSDYAQRFIVDRLAVVDGVSNVRIGGERTILQKELEQTFSALQ